MTTDELKLARDGHLEYGKVQSKDHAWIKPIFPTVCYYRDEAGNVVGELRGMDGYGHVLYGRQTEHREDVA